MSRAKAKAVIFGAIGAFSETSNLQRQTFNRALALNGIDKPWNTEEYRDLIKKFQGGMNRLEQTFPDSSQQMLESIYEEKNRLFLSGLVEKDHLLPDFEVFCKTVLENDMRIAIASTTHLETIDAILANLKDITRDDFAFIGHMGMVQNVKPAPDIYNVALDSLGLKPTEVVAIEDTHTNLESAIRAGIEHTIALPGAMCKDQDFSKAQLVLDGYSNAFRTAELF